MEYQQFLESKIKLSQPVSAFAKDARLDPSLFPHQRDSVRWALSRQTALIAARFGLGKTRIQIAIAKALHEATGKPFLIVCPLGVKHQFQEEDGPAMGTDWQYVRTDAEVEAATSPYLITNYERVRDGNIDPRKHSICGVSLDEGSVIRSLGSKTFQVFQDAFAHVEYKFVCTATPSPNNHRELIYYADFLGVRDKGASLTRWFQRNPDKAGDLTLLPQYEEEYWLWVSTWALFLESPADLGYDATGYDLPPLRVHYHCVPTDHSRAGETVDRHGQRSLIIQTAAGVSAATQEKRATLSSRVAKAKEIMDAEPGEHWLLWHHLEDERRTIEKVIPEAVTIYGSQDIEKREQSILDFSRGKIPVLAAKPILAGSGCNFQRHCSRNIFVGVDFKFQDFIQACHRTARFLQKSPVDVHIIYSEAESGVIEILKQKWQLHDELTERMSVIMKKYGLSQSAIEDDLKRKIGVNRTEVKGERFTLIHNDCVQETKTLADNSVGMICTSIPFGNHYEYTENVEDFGHNPSDEDFFVQMDFLIPDLYRVLNPGRVASIHVKDRILYGHQTKSGFLEVEEFSDDTVKAFRKHGFLYEGRRTIVTDVVRENASTYRLGWSEMAKDASKMGSGLPEYVLQFRKPASSNAQQYADEPIVKSKEKYTRAQWQLDAHALWRSNGARPLTPEEYAQLEPSQIYQMNRAEQLSSAYDYERHVAICEELDRAGRLPSGFMQVPTIVTQSNEDMVWDNVQFMGNLNAAQSRKREANHVCPLPFDIVERLIRLYSNEGDIILDPFSGLGTTAYCAVKLRRYGVGIELNPDYFAASAGYLKAIEREVLSPSLLDLMEKETAEIAA